MAYHPILYKLLGIPDTGTEPTAYRLLGINPQDCTPKLVQTRLMVCTKRLRQNIPGPQFIPMVARWEVELDRAAEVLTDPGKRQSYHSTLATETRKQRAQGAPAAPPGATVSQTIESAVNENFTLDEDRRPILVNRLRELRVPEPHIQSSLADIPRPVPRVAGMAPGAMPFYSRAIDLSLGQGLLNSRDEAALVALAAKLSIPADMAAQAIEERLAARGARRIQGHAGPRIATSGSPPSVSPRVPLRTAAMPPAPASHSAPQNVPHPMPPDLDAEMPQIDDQQVVESILAESEVPAREEGLSVWFVVIPVVAAVLFIALAFVFLWPSGPTSTVTPPARPTSPAVRAKTPVPVKIPSTPSVLVVPPKAVVDPTPPSPGEAPPKPGPAAVPPTEPPVIAAPRVPPSGPGAAEVRRAYTASAAPDALLSDLALTMLACRDRAARLTGNSAGQKDTEVARLLTAADRAAELTRSVNLSPTPFAAPVVVVAPPPAPARGLAAPVPMAVPADAATIAKDMAASSTTVRYRAIERLREMDSAEAADALLAALQIKARSSAAPDLKTAFRILAALKAVHQNKIPAALVDLLLTCQSGPIAFQIVRTLEEGTGIATDDVGKLPYVHLMTAQKAASEWWWTRTTGKAITWPAAGGAAAVRAAAAPKGILDPAALPAAVTAAWQPDPAPLKLLGAANAAAAAAAEDLKAWKWGGAAAPASRPAGTDAVLAGPDVGTEFAQSLGIMVDQLDRLVREHPAGKANAIRADIVVQLRQARTLAADTPLQKAAVELDTATALLELLVEESDPGGTSRAAVARLKTERKAALDGAANVLQELREAAYFNLALWDLLASNGGHAP